MQFRRYRPSELFLLEPFSGLDRLDSYRLRFGFDYTICGARDTLWIFWNSNLTLNIESLFEQSVIASCTHATVSSVFWITFVYARTQEHLRGPLRVELDSVLGRLPLSTPWSVVGDFNCLLSVNEKKRWAFVSSSEDHYILCLFQFL